MKKTKTTMMMMKLIGRTLMIALAGIALGVACEKEGDGDDGGCDEDTKGFTECNLLTCQPGQYCDVGCANGCLSDVNCACNQVCDKPAGQNVGTCVAKAPEPTGTTGAATTADPTEGANPWALQCEHDCDGLNGFMCFQPGDLQACYDRCAGVTQAQVMQFETCVTGAIGDCAKLIACQDNLP